MLYAIMATDVNDSLKKRQMVRDKHIKRLNDLKDEGRLVLAGPHPAINSNDPGQLGWTGSLVVAQFKNLSQAKEWANHDPYIASGAYDSVLVKPFKQVLP